MTKTCTRIARSLLLPLLLCVAALLAAYTAPARAEISKEQDIKIAYLLNFARYTVWPQTPVNRLSICIFRDSELALRLAEAVKGRVINELTLTSVNINAETEIEQCHLLYFPVRTDNSEPLSTYALMAGKPILTVGETKAFSDQGGGIRFLHKDNVIRFDVQLDAVRASGLNLSSRLLQHAHTVISKNVVKP